MRRDKRLSIMLTFAALVMCLTIGYAALSTNLNINGLGSINSASWDIHFENIHITDGSVTGENVTKDATIDSDTSISYNIRLRTPGDFYEFTVDVKNSGTIDGMITSLSSKINGVEITTLPNWLEYSVTYEDGAPIQNNHILNAGDKETYKVRIRYNDNISPSDLPSENQPINAEISIEIGQKDESGVPPAHYLKVGDYVTLVPDLTTYTIPTSLTGASEDQTINPSELTLWRVINKNSDGTYDVVSEYVSNNKVYFSGVIGYSKYIESMQTIASKYQKSGYTNSARMIGYDGQTLVIENTYYFDGSTRTSPGLFETPSPTTGVGEEYEGGLKGDTLYLKDYQLVSNVYLNYNYDSSYGSTGLKAYDKTNTSSTYWIASRSYYDRNVQSYNFYNRRIKEDGSLTTGTMRLYNRNDRKWINGSSSAGFRPILTLYSNIKTSGGNGTKEQPYNLSNN